MMDNVLAGLSMGPEYYDTGVAQMPNITNKVWIHAGLGTIGTTCPGRVTMLEHFTYLPLVVKSTSTSMIVHVGDHLWQCRD